MTLRPARLADFLHLETFVWQAIFPSFDLPELSEAQRAENDALVAGARVQVETAMSDVNTAVFVAIDPLTKGLVGYVIADAAPRAYAEIPFIVVKRSYWGKGVAGQLMAAATNFIGRDRAISVSVRYYNHRALAFFVKHDFEDTGETSGDHAIPRTLLLREAYEVVTPITLAASNDVNHHNMDNNKEDAWGNFPTEADEPVPVFEALPDYRLRTDEEAPLYDTGTNALATEVLDDTDPGATTLSDDQLSELEAFIARARATKAKLGTPKQARSPQGVNSPYPAEKKVAAAAPSSASVGASAAEQADKRAVGSGSKPVFDRSKIAFEVDFGDGRSVAVPAEHHEGDGSKVGAAATTGPTSFAFAFDATPAERLVKTAKETTFSAVTTEATTRSEAVLAEQVATASRLPLEKTVASEGGTRVTKACPDCTTTLPTAARFCFNCGYPQPETGPLTSAGQADVGSEPPEDFLTLGDLADDVLKPTPPSAPAKPVNEKVGDVNTGSHRTSTPPNEGPKAEDAAAKSPPPGRHHTLGGLKQSFREYLDDRVTAYFGSNKLAAYYSELERATEFQQLRDGILSNLLSWLNEAGRQQKEQERRVRGTLADLTEYFIVETAAKLSNRVLPQRLLRHQSVDWATVDLFRLVMDYLDFEREREVIYTDFVTMPARALRNATKSFLRAGKDERIFFICDQSLVSQAKNGFAITDSGIYWKNVLQPAGVAMFNEIESLRLKDGYLELDGQFFNGGGSLNLKIALLLDKLRRLG